MKTQITLKSLDALSFEHIAAALGVAAHECGHAIQHQQAYAPLQLRMAAVGVTSFASQLVLWIPLLGAFTGLLAPRPACSSWRWRGAL